MSKFYSLYYRNILLGAVSQINSEFPGASGEFTPHTGDDEPEERTLIVAYIELSKKISAAYTREGGEPDQQLLNEEETMYDRLGSGPWRLVNADGKEDHILMPIFHRDGGISWR